MADRKHILFGITEPDDKLFLSKMCDIAERSEVSYKTMFSKFLDLKQSMMVRDRLSKDFFVNFFGGYEGAERLVASFGENTYEYPIAALEISPKSKRRLSHRDYLGSLLALGIKRELLGDIIVEDEGATVFVMAEIADFIAMNLKKAASDTVRVKSKDLSDVKASEKSFKEQNLTVSSMRADCVIGAATSLSRAKCAKAIEEGICRINYDVVKSCNFQVKDGDILSVKGFGKMEIKTNGSVTKKGRIHILVKKYI